MKKPKERIADMANNELGKLILEKVTNIENMIGDCDDCQVDDFIDSLSEDFHDAMEYIEYLQSKVKKLKKKNRKLKDKMKSFGFAV